MARVRYTSAIDLSVRIVLCLSFLLLCFALADALGPLVAASFGDLSTRDSSAAALALSSLIIVFTLGVLPGDLDEHMATISAWFYALITLRVRFTWLEAKAVADLFAYSGHDTWYPLEEVRHLQPKLRKRAIFEMAARSGRMRDPLAQARQLKWKRRAVGLALVAWVAFVAFADRQYADVDLGRLAAWGLIPAALYGAVYYLVIAKARPVAP